MEQESEVQKAYYTRKAEEWMFLKGEITRFAKQQDQLCNRSLHLVGRCNVGDLRGDESMSLREQARAFVQPMVAQLVPARAASLVEEEPGCAAWREENDWKFLVFADSRWKAY